MKKAAELCHRQIDAYNSDPIREERFDRYNFAQDIYDDWEVPTRLHIIKDVNPVNWPLLQVQVDGAIRMVVSAFNGADPYFIFTGGDDSELREAREKDTHLSLVADEYTDKKRACARNAAIKGRGPYRIVWEEKKKGGGWIQASSVKDGEMEFVGPKEITINAEDFGLYPLSVSKITDARSVWHRFDRPMYEIWEMQDRNEYFSRELVPVTARHEQKTAAEEPEDYAPNLYRMIVKLPPGMDTTKDLVAYEVTLYYSEQVLLYMKEYDKPRPDYFAPSFKYDPDMFWPVHSVGSSIIGMQTEVNDAQFARKMAAVAAIKKTVFVAGYAGEMTTMDAMMGEIHLVRGDIKVHQIETTNMASGDLGALAQEAQQYAEATSGFSQVAAGQLPEASQTATATGGALQGTADEGEEKQSNFLKEEVAAVQFRQTLIRRNFSAYKKFHGKKLQTKKASDWDAQFEIGANGQGANNNPQATLEKLKLLLESYMQIEIPWLEDVEAGISANVGIAISKKEFALAISQNLDFAFSTEKIIVDTTTLPNIEPPVGDPTGPFGAIGGPETLIDPALGGAAIPPELLAILAQGGGPAGFPPPMAMPPPGIELGGNGFDPLLAQLAAGGMPLT